MVVCARMLLLTIKLPSIRNPDVVSVGLVPQAAVGLIVDRVVDETDLAIHEQEVRPAVVPAAESPVVPIVPNVLRVGSLRIERHGGGGAREAGAEGAAPVEQFGA